MINKKIAFFTEAPQEGIPPRNFPNHRTEYAWYTALQAVHHNIGRLPQLDNDMYDLGIVIIPKSLI